MKPAAIVALVLALSFLCGCTREADMAYSVDSLAVESRVHVLSKEYGVFADISANSFNATNILVLYEDGVAVGRLQLNGSGTQGKNKNAIFVWGAHETGTHELRVVQESPSGEEVSNSKAVEVVVEPFGFYELGDLEHSYQVEEGIWCAQRIKIESNASISSIELNLRSPVPARQGRNVTLEVRSSGEVPPEGNGGILFSGSLPSTMVKSSPQWHSLWSGSRELPAGEYWLLLKRDDTVGSLSWTYSEEGGSGGALCRDLAVSPSWANVSGSFAFRIS